MKKLSDIQKLLPTPSRDLINLVWTAVPEKDRASLEETFKGLPLDRNPLNMLIDLAMIHLKTTFAASKKVAIIGPANVGKSTLFNQFVRAKTDHAEVSPVPGTTRVNKEADAGIFAMIDTPGADAVGAVGEAERQAAFAAAEQADFLIMMFDAMQGIKQTELALYEDLLALKKPFIIILNKIDLTHKHRAEVLAKAAENLGVRRRTNFASFRTQRRRYVYHPDVDHCRRPQPYRCDGACHAAISSENRLASNRDFIVTGGCHRAYTLANNRFHSAYSHTSWIGSNNRSHLRVQNHTSTRQGANCHIWSGDDRANALPTALQAGRSTGLVALVSDRIFDDCGDGLYVDSVVRKRGTCQPKSHARYEQDAYSLSSG